MLGYEAARLLDDVLDGKDAPLQLVVAPAPQVHERASSSHIAVSDGRIRTALEYVADHYTGNIGVEDIAAAAGLSKTTLHMQFLRHLGITPAREILRCRLNHASKLLIDTDQPVEKVGRDSGFADTRNVYKVFMRELGLTPQAFRQTHKKKEASSIRTEQAF
jgi:LacI family transcriptional regulator